MKRIAIIPARGGSKRIPRKNIKDFCGRPIIEYSIQAALDSLMFEKVIVSTDDEEIANIARNAGAQIPFMRKNTGNDFATVGDTIKEALIQCKELGEEYDIVGCVYATAPFVSAELLREAVLRLEDSDADTAAPVVRFGFPPQRALVINDKGIAGYQYPENALARSQDLQPIYHDAGQFCICRCERIMQGGSLITQNTLPIIIPESAVQDIDTETDWLLAEMKYKLQGQIRI